MKPIEYFFSKINNMLPAAESVTYCGVWCNGTIQFRVETRNNIFVFYFSTKDSTFLKWVKIA